ncbi:MAG TPA: MerR family transcriptional regulator [Candidatus Dormibacteraeota bacterium]|nr:MerR family transcriptional regulator [Candidatus Dormibacteraeota bacterium]
MPPVNEEDAHFLSIGEFARRCKLSISALRFYGDCGVLVPARTDDATGYRFYTADQLATAELIRYLRVLEMPLAEIERFLAADVTAAQALLDRHANRLQERMQRNQEALAAVHSLLGSKESRMSAITTVPGDRLARAIRDVFPAAGRLEKRDYPAAVLFELREDGLRLAATDGHRLAVRDLPAQTDENRTLRNHRRGCVCPGATRRLSTSRGPPTRDGATWEVRAAGDDYPDYEAILARGGTATLIVKAQDLRDRLADQQDLIVLDLSEGAAAVNGVRLAGRYKGKNLRIGFNPAYLAEALDSAVGPEVILRLGGPLDPVTIRSADDGTLTWLVMPIRLQEPART